MASMEVAEKSGRRLLSNIVDAGKVDATPPSQDPSQGIDAESPAKKQKSSGDNKLMILTS